MWRERNQTEFDSQLITLCNAYFHLTGQSIPDSKYTELLHLCNGYGEEIVTDVIFDVLGLQVTEQKEISNIIELTYWNFYEARTYLRNKPHSFGLKRLQIGMIRTFNYSDEHRYVFGNDLIGILATQEDDIPIWNVRSFGLR